MGLAAIFAVFVASLLGSVHCAAMCGGLAGFCSNSAKHSKLATTSYHLGRGISYIALGAIVGGLGSQVNILSNSWGLGGLVSIFVGSILVIWGLISLFSNHTPAFVSRFSGKISQIFAKQLNTAREKKYPSIGIGGLTGLLTVFLPCGWLHAFVLVCAVSGSATKGALTMAAFWLGSVPALLLVSAGFGLLKPSFSRNAPRIGGFLLVVAGLTSIFARDTMMNIIPESMMSHSMHQQTDNPHSGHQHSEHGN